MASWQVQEAKARFSEILKTALTNGPQIITSRGVETAVIVSIDEWQSAKPGRKFGNGEKELTAQQRAQSEAFLRLLQSGPDFEIPDRHQERLAARKASKQRVSA